MSEIELDEVEGPLESESDFSSEPEQELPPVVAVEEEDDLDEFDEDDFDDDFDDDFEEEEDDFDYGEESFEGENDNDADGDTELGDFDDE